MKINEFLKKHPTTENNHLRPLVICKDGLALSVQASYYHYCTPEKNNAPEYSTVEIQPQNRKKLRSLREYQDRDSVYAFVPVEKLDALIKWHGGMQEEAVCLPRQGGWYEIRHIHRQEF